MKLKLTQDLAPIRLQAAAAIDAAAEACRGRFITLGSGQAMVYAQKEKEAEMVSADPEVNQYLVPHVVREAERYGISLLDAATAILIKANEWRNLSPYIEDPRLAAKEQLELARNPAEIEAIVASTRAYYGAL